MVFLKAGLAVNSEQVFNLRNIVNIATLYLCQPKWHCFSWVEDFSIRASCKVRCIRVDDDPTHHNNLSIASVCQVPIPALFS